MEPFWLLPTGAAGLWEERPGRLLKILCKMHGPALHRRIVCCKLSVMPKLRSWSIHPLWPWTQRRGHQHQHGELTHSVQYLEAHELISDLLMKQSFSIWSSCIPALFLGLRPLFTWGHKDYFLPDFLSQKSIDWRLVNTLFSIWKIWTL